jgi:hypothetical protein
MYLYRPTSMLRWGGPKDMYITLRMDLMPDSRESQSQRPPFPSTCRLHEQPLYIDFSVLIPLSPVPELHSILKGIFDLLPRPLFHPLFEVLNVFLCDSFFSNCLCRVSFIDNRKISFRARPPRSDLTHAHRLPNRRCGYREIGRVLEVR